MTQAFAAADAGNFAEALRLWAKVGEMQPSWTIGYAGRAGALRGLGRLNEAMELLTAGIDRFPDDPVILVELGWLLTEGNDREAALAIWRNGMKRHPGVPAFHVGYATVQRLRQQFDDADDVLTRAGALFPDTCFVWTNYAITADVRGDGIEALRRWQTVMTRFPGEAIAYAGLGAALKVLRRFGEADQVLETGIAKFPNDRNLSINHARAATAARKWSAAMVRWAALQTRWPDDEAIQQGCSEALVGAKLAAAEEGLPGQSGGEWSSVGTPNAELLMEFESIGENCELGFVQRHYDAEPLSLFRWAGIGYHHLLQALESGLQGIGDPVNTVVSVYEDNGEYLVSDARYGMSLHSFIFDTEATVEDVKARMCRRTTFLKNKLLEDLRAPSKIFVFNATAPLSDDQLRQLQAALHRYGPVSLLHVAPHPDIEAGQAIAIGAGLWRGSLTRTGNNGPAWDIDFGCWLTLCKATQILRGPVAV